MKDADLRISKDVAAGAAADEIYHMEAASQTVDEHVTAMYVWLENAPGGGKTVTVTATNGTDSMIVSLTGAAEIFNSNVEDRFHWRTRTQTFNLSYTSTAGTATGHMSIHVQKHREREVGVKH